MSPPSPKHTKPDDIPKDENGFTCCRWCDGPVKPPKKTMCSPECVHEILLEQIIII